MIFYHVTPKTWQVWRKRFLLNRVVHSLVLPFTPSAANTTQGSVLPRCWKYSQISSWMLPSLALRELAHYDGPLMTWSRRSTRCQSLVTKSSPSVNHLPMPRLVSKTRKCHERVLPVLPCEWPWQDGGYWQKNPVCIDNGVQSRAKTSSQVTGQQNPQLVHWTQHPPHYW